MFFRSAARSFQLRLTRRRIATPSSTVTTPKIVEHADGILANHGGKVAAVAMSLAVFFFYSFYQSGQNRSSLEDKIFDELPLEPYEVQEIVQANKLGRKQYDGLVDMAYKRFPNRRLTYAQFISFIKETTPVKGGHLIDRVARKYITSHPEGGGQEGGQEELPLEYLLVTLNLLVKENAEAKTSSLFQLGQRMENGDKGYVDIPSEEEEVLSVGTAYDVVGGLLESCQIPWEKQAIETGVKYPFKTYRPKTPQDFVSAARKRMKPPHDREWLTEAEFSSILLGTDICAWGECYHSDN